jgi:hypothetical protein
MNRDPGGGKPSMFSQSFLGGRHFHNRVSKISGGYFLPSSIPVIEVLYRKLALALGPLPVTKPVNKSVLDDLIKRCFDYADQSDSMGPENHRQAFIRLIGDFRRFSAMQSKASEDMPRYVRVNEAFDEMYRCVDGL